MTSHRAEIEQINIGTTLNNAKTSITRYLNTVGQINECSKYTIDSANIASAIQLANPIDTYEAKLEAIEIAEKAKAYAKSVKTSFDWSWKNGTDIKSGADLMNQRMNNIHLNASIKYSMCQSVTNNITKPKFYINNHNYRINFDKNHFKNQLASKAASIRHGKCKKESLNFDFFPNDFNRVAANTVSEIDIDKIILKYGRMSYNDRKRYLDAYHVSPFESLFKTPPCDSFKKEYYELLRNAKLQFELH